MLHISPTPLKGRFSSELEEICRVMSFLLIGPFHNMKKVLFTSLKPSQNPLKGVGTCEKLTLTMGHFSVRRPYLFYYCSHLAPRRLRRTFGWGGIWDVLSGEQNHLLKSRRNIKPSEIQK